MKDENAGATFNASLRILLIEDNPGDARLFEEHLREGALDFTLHREHTLEAGLTALRQESPDVLVVDLGLPDTEGVESVEHCAEVAPSVPIVVLTGRDDLQTAHAAQEAGATEYLQKGGLTPELAARTLRWAARQARMRSQLRQRDALVRSIAENVSGGIFRTGPTGRIEYANDAFAELFGYDRVGDVLDTDLTTLYAIPEDRGRVLAQEGVEDAEVPFRRRDGTEFVALLSAQPVYDANGDVLHFDGVVTDITGRREREEERRILAEAVGQTDESVLVTEAAPLDEPGPRIVYVNSAFETQTGYTEEEVLGKTPRILQGPETDREVLDSFRTALEAGQSWEGETVNYRKDGNTYVVHWNVSPLRNEEGEIEYWVSVQRDVTEERRRETDLRRSRERYRSLFENSNDAILVHDLDGRIQEANPKARALFGYAPEEMVGQALPDLHPSEEEETARAKLEALRRGEPFRTTARYQRKDGSTFWGEISASVSRLEGEPVVRTMIRNVTKQKEAEEKLREREARIRGLANSIPGVVFQFYARPDGTYGHHFISDHAEDLLGIPADPDTFYERFLERVPEGHQEPFVRSIEAAVEEERPWRTEVPFDRPDGERMWLLGTSTPERTEEELIFNGVILDITQRKRAEHDLRQSRDRLALQARMLDEVGQAVIATDAQGEVTFWNDAAQRMYGWSEEEALGRNVMDLTVPEGAEGVADEIMASLTEGKAWTGEFAVQRKDGSTFPAIVSNAPILDDDGELEGVIGGTTDITEQKGIEEALREQEAQLRGLANSIPGIPYQFYARPDGTYGFYFVGERAEELLGISAETDDFFDRFVERVPASRRSELIQSIDEAVEQEAEWQVEIPFKTPAGERIWLLGRSTPERRGEELVFNGVLLDITRRKQAEARTRLQSRVLEQVTEGVSLETILVDLVAEIESLRPDMLGSIQLYDSAEGRIRHGAAPSLPDAYNEAVDGLEVGPKVGSCGTAMHTGEPVIAEDIREDPRWEAYRDTALEHGLRACWSVPILGSETEMLGTFAMYYRTPKRPSEADRTLIDYACSLARIAIERSRHEQALRDERDRFATLFGSLPTPVVHGEVQGDQDREVVVLDVNTAFEEVFGYDADQIQGEYLRAFIVPPDREDEAFEINEQVVEGEALQTEVRRLTADGVRDFQLQVATRSPVDGPTEVYAIYTDITEQKRRERELQAAKEEAEEASQLKSAMLANMSHEIRTPLTSITGFAEVLTEELDGELAEFGERIFRGGQRLMKTLESVLELSKLEAGVRDIQRESLRLDAVVEETVDLFQREADEKAITLETHWRESVEGRWNEGALSRVAENLLGNAIKFTPEGGRVDVRVWENGTDAYLEVEDTGVGIGDEALPQIFEAFKQESEGLGREYEGSGLGLSIVKKLTDALGGEIEVKSEKGVGTRFTVRLPRSASEARNERAENEVTECS